MSLNTGWIKISREITEHWLWSDAERLKWWLDLLFMANWDDRKVMHDTHLFTLKRGQMIASVSFLAERWNKSNPTIIKFLKLLEDEDMICRQTLYRQTPIITICNYDKYQERSDTQVDTIVNTQVDTIVDTIKEYKEDNNIYNTTHTREESFYDELVADEQYIEMMAMRYHTTTEKVTSSLYEFKQENGLKDARHNSLREYKSHFHDWLRYQIEKQNKNNGNNNRRAQQSTREQRASETAAQIRQLLNAGRQ